MNRILKIVFMFAILLITLVPMSIAAEESKGYSIQNIEDKEPEFVTEYVIEDYNVCSVSSVKTYMDYRAINDRSSVQYKYIKEYMTVDETTGLLVDEDGFIGVALGSAFGEIGDKYIFTLDSGEEYKFVKIEQKADIHTVNGCQHINDNSVIEFVIDTAIAKEYYGVNANGYIFNGNFNNSDDFSGRIESIVQVLGTVEVEIIEPLELVENPLSVGNFYSNSNKLLDIKIIG